MREWEQVRRGLDTRIRQPRTVRIYVDVAKERAPLAHFATPTELVAFLERLHRDPSSNDILLSVVATWRDSALCQAELAAHILCLGLWSLLSALYHRQRHYWDEREAELPSEITRSLATVARGTDLSRVESVALTLVRDTERTLVKRHQREIAHLEVDRDPAIWFRFETPRHENADESDQLPADRIEYLRAALGPDFDIVMAAYETGCDFDRMGAHFGLTEDEIKRRIRRAWRRLRKLQGRNRAE